MRLVTYVHRSLYDSLLSQDVTLVNNPQLVLWDKLHGDCNGIPCIAGAPEHRSMSFLTVVEFWPYVGINRVRDQDSEWLLVELEVPEDGIVHLRPRDELSLTSIDGSDRGFPRRDIRVDRDKLQWLRGYYKEDRCDNFRNEAAWAVLSCIRRDWIVSIREFLSIQDDYLNSRHCRILYMDCRKFPLWRETSYISFNMRKMLSWVRDSDAPRVEDYCKDYEKITAYQDLVGMHGCPGYFTVEEAMNCCDWVTKGVIATAVKRSQLGRRSQESILIQDLFGGDLVKVDRIPNEKIHLLSKVFTKEATRASIRSVYRDDDIRMIYKYIVGHEQVLSDVDVMVDILLDTATVYGS